MTYQSEVLNDPSYRLCLDHGFVGLVDTMGSDNEIVRAARVSYGAGTKTVNEDRGLIRYLIRMAHSSPIEMAEVKLHIKLPIFVMRQLVRHRTASLNEYSGRYSVMTDEFYIPESHKIMAQSTTNKQGRDGRIENTDVDHVLSLMRASYDQSRDTYRLLLGDHTTKEAGGVIFSDRFQGISREMARFVLPVSAYTECYWKQDLHNLLHLLKLRRDAHAQDETRVYAEMIYDLVRPRFPLVCEAWEDYIWNGLTLSRMERAMIEDIIATGRTAFFERCITEGEENVARSYGLSAREFQQFRDTWAV